MTAINVQIPFTATVLSQRDYAFVICLIRQFVAEGDLAEDDPDTLLALMVGEDLTGRKWIYDPDLGIWANTDVQPWQEGVPRGPLLVALPNELWDDVRPLLDQIGKAEAEARRERQGATCPACGAVVEAGVHYCAQCGAILPVIEETAPARKRSPHFCPNCGSALAPSQRFCTDCGQDLTTPPHST